MIRKTTLAAMGALALATAGCAPITSYNGFQAQDVKPDQVKVGEDSRSTVLSKLGSPSVQGAFDADTWYYVSQISDKYAYYTPKVRDRTVVEIKFDKEEKVTLVKSYKLTDGYVIAYDKRETPTRGRELSVIEQILGGLGRGGLLPQDNDPGNPGGNRR
jgi:outer membrane protein assembly factor BamE (lipoprotein component of BamABCDE complex)